MQVCHGKGGPLRRLHAGDRVAYYSPVRVFGGKPRCQAFTAAGIVCDARVYRAEIDAGFQPSRRNVAWLPAKEASIHPLLPSLSFARGKAANWGQALRFGLLKVTEADMAGIMQAMDVELALHAPC